MNIKKHGEPKRTNLLKLALVHIPFNWPFQLLWNSTAANVRVKQNLIGAWMFGIVTLLFEITLDEVRVKLKRIWLLLSYKAIITETATCYFHRNCTFQWELWALYAVFSSCVFRFGWTWRNGAFSDISGRTQVNNSFLIARTWIVCATHSQRDTPKRRKRNPDRTKTQQVIDVHQHIFTGKSNAQNMCIEINLITTCIYVR